LAEAEIMAVVAGGADQTYMCLAVVTITIGVTMSAVIVLEVLPVVGRHILVVAVGDEPHK
jgi:hypothetical protein